MIKIYDAESDLAKMKAMAESAGGAFKKVKPAKGKFMFTSEQAAKNFFEKVLKDRSLGVVVTPAISDDGLSVYINFDATLQDSIADDGSFFELVKGGKYIVLKDSKPIFSSRHQSLAEKHYKQAIADSNARFNKKSLLDERARRISELSNKISDSEDDEDVLAIALDALNEMEPADIIEVLVNSLDILREQIAPEEDEEVVEDVPVDSEEEEEGEE